VNSAGVPYGLARLYVYESGGTTPVTTYTTAAYNVQHTHPVVADSNGLFPAIFIDPVVGSGLTIRVMLKTSADALIYDQDGVAVLENAFGNITTGDITSSGTLQANSGFVRTRYFESYHTTPRNFWYETDRGTDLKAWDINIASGVWSLRTRTDADGTGKNIFVVTRGATTAISAIDIGNATDLPVITLNGTTIVAANIAQLSASSFTGTFTGMTGATTGSISYRVNGNWISLYSSASVFGTSNTTAMTMTGLPVALRPSGNRFVFAALMDNSAQIGGLAYLSNSDTIEFSTGVNGAGAFTAAGSKGIFAGFTLMYPL
jgi:hypothetical protein